MFAFNTMSAETPQRDWSLPKLGCSHAKPIPLNTEQVSLVFVPYVPSKTLVPQADKLEHAQSLHRSRYSTPPLFPFCDHANQPMPLLSHSCIIKSSSMSHEPLVACWYPNSPTI